MKEKNAQNKMTTKALLIPQLLQVIINVHVCVLMK